MKRASNIGEMENKKPGLAKQSTQKSVDMKELLYLDKQQKSKREPMESLGKPSRKRSTINQSPSPYTMNKEACPSSPAYTFKIGLNGATPVNIKKGPEPPQMYARHIQKHAQKADSIAEQEEMIMSTLNLQDDFGDAMNSHKWITLSRMTGLEQSNKFEKVSPGYLIKFVEETCIVLSTRYCNYSSADISIQTGAPFEQVQCFMVYLERVEMLSSVNPGELLTCIAEIQFTGYYCMDIKFFMWAEDIYNSSKRLVMKGLTWTCSLNLSQNNRLTKIPKLQPTEIRLEKEGQTRYEQYKEERNRVNNYTVSYSHVKMGSKDERDSIVNTVAYSETLFTHICTLKDCNVHMFMNVGCIVELMEVCSQTVAIKHIPSDDVVPISAYQLTFVELIPRGAVCLIYGRIIYTSSKYMEIEVIVDVESSTSSRITTKRHAQGYFGYVCMDGGDWSVPLTIPRIKLTREDEQARNRDGKLRYELMKKHMPNVESKLNPVVAHDDLTKKSVTYTKPR